MAPSIKYLYYKRTSTDTLVQNCKRIERSNERVMAFLLKLMSFVRFVDSWHRMTMKCGDWSFKRDHLIDAVYQNYTNRQTSFSSTQSAAMSIKTKQIRSMWSSNQKLVSLEWIWWRYRLYSWAVWMDKISLSIIHSNSKGRILIWIQFWRLCYWCQVDDMWWNIWMTLFKNRWDIQCSAFSPDLE